MGWSTKTFHAPGQNPTPQQLGAASHPLPIPPLNSPAQASSSEAGTESCKVAPTKCGEDLPGTGSWEPVPTPRGIQDIDGKNHHPMKQP